jgi:tRNA-dihydrouridine synthase A
MSMGHKAYPSSFRCLSVAPMMERTDRHFRYFLRQISRHTLLYTPMLTVPAILHGDRPKLLDFDPAEKPLVLQLGGDDPRGLADCARIAADWGYDEVNLNVGCPSDRVQNGNFGACLMAQPQQVAAAVAAMKGAVDLPVTVKHRIGIDDLDRYEDMVRFVTTVAEVGCDRFSVHARKAWLQGLDPKQNRTIPPLRHGDVHRLKQAFPHLCIEINGGILNLDQAQDQLHHVDAVMIGRAAYDTPYIFAGADRRFFTSLSNPGPMSNPGPISNPDPLTAPLQRTRHQVVQAMVPYIDRWTHQNLKLHRITRHMLQLFAGQPGSRAWKRYITEHSCKPGAGGEVLEAALAQVPEPILVAEAVGSQ